MAMKRSLVPAVLAACLVLMMAWGTARADDIPLVTGEHWTRSTEQVKKAYLVGIANVIQLERAYAAANPPAEGAGLDPLLLHPSMMIHPPMLYSGYTLLTIPFAFAVGALVTGRLGAEWIAVTRRFALAAWLFLGIGILLGARWSYTELG